MVRPPASESDCSVFSKGILHTPDRSFSPLLRTQGTLSSSQSPNMSFWSRLADKVAHLCSQVAGVCVSLYAKLATSILHGHFNQLPPVIRRF